MSKKHVLFISGSLGLGHVMRDLAIATELRKQNPNVELSWFAAPPASSVLKDAGESLLPENDRYFNFNDQAENSASQYKLNVLAYLIKSIKGMELNARMFLEVISRNKFDLIIGDEAFDLAHALLDKRIDLGAPFVMIYDFIGVEAMSNSILEKLGIYYFNWDWSKHRKLYDDTPNIGLFIGELEDIEDKRFGMFLPNRRDFTRTYCNVIGYTLQFDPADYADITKIRSQLGYGPEPLIMCSIGGTAVGKDLLELCGLAFPIIKKQIPNLRMVLVCGPRLSANSLKILPGPEIKQYIPDLYKHNACCDLAIVQGGGTTTLELTALRRPFLYFPLEGHCEQQIAVASRLIRHRAGVRMNYKDTSSELLAQQVIAHLGQKTDYADIPVNGSYEAARLINDKVK